MVLLLAAGVEWIWASMLLFLLLCIRGSNILKLWKIQAILWCLFVDFSCEHKAISYRFWKTTHSKVSSNNFISLTNLDILEWISLAQAFDYMVGWGLIKFLDLFKGIFTLVRSLSLCLKGIFIISTIIHSLFKEVIIRVVSSWLEWIKGTVI